MSLIKLLSNRLILVLVVLTAVGIGFPLAASASLPHYRGPRAFDSTLPGADDELASLVHAYVKPYVEARSFSGTILLARGGKILLSKGYGMANYERGVPNTPETKFHIASVSKSFTAAAIMMLAERGLLTPDDALARFIPDYPDGAKITVHHLLVHTSGIPNINDFPTYNQASKSPQTPESLIAMFKDKPLAMTPGERYSYSNSNYNVLAYIIEKLSGLSYGEFLRRNIFEPLGMKSSGHDGNASVLIKNQASGYVPVGLRDLENAPYLDWSVKTGNGSLYTTVEDLFTWDRALYTEKILKKAAIDKMFTAHIDGTGYGWFVGRRLNRRVVRMNGRSPGFQCEIQRYVDDDVCVIVLSNNYSGTASLMIDDLAAIVFGEPHEPFVLSDSTGVDVETAEDVCGLYRGGQDFIRPGAAVTVEKKDGYLALDWGGGYVSALLPAVGGGYFDRQFGGRVYFIRDENGQVVKLIWRSGQDYPAKKVR